MKHKLLINAFDQWWKSEIEYNAYELIHSNTGVIVSPSLRFNAKIIYDKTDDNLIENKSGTSAEQVQMEVWMLSNLPTLNIERRALERKRKSYERMTIIEKSFNDLLDRKLK